jgi:CO dehydrogenase/acetyl-CoA synthase beta subunit
MRKINSEEESPKSFLCQSLKTDSFPIIENWGENISLTEEEEKNEKQLVQSDIRALVLVHLMSEILRSKMLDGLF